MRTQEKLGTLEEAIKKIIDQFSYKKIIIIDQFKIDKFIAPEEA